MMDANKSYQSTGSMRIDEQRGFPDFFHCNSCGRRPATDGGYDKGTSNYSLAACGHIYCQTCVEKVSIRAGDIPSDSNIVCPSCKRRTRVQPINQQLPSKCAMLFTDPTEMLKRSLEQMRTVMNYQKGQSRLLQQRNDHMVRQLSKKIKFDEQMLSQKGRENENLKSRVAELERQLRAKQKEAEERERMNASYRSDNTHNSRSSLAETVNSLTKKFGRGTSSLSRQPSARDSSSTSGVASTTRVVNKPRVMEPMHSGVVSRSAMPAAAKKPLPPQQTRAPPVPYRPVRRDLRAMTANSSSGDKQQVPAPMRFNPLSFNSFVNSTPGPHTTATGAGRKAPTMVVVPGKIATKGPLISQPRMGGGGMTK